MNSKSASSAAKSASSVLSSGSSQASSAAGKASESLSAGSAKASSIIQGAAGDTETKSASMFAATPLTLSILAVAVGYAYFNGYLDGLIAFLQQLMGQAQDRKEQVMKENTGQTSVRAAAKDQYDTAKLKSEDLSDQLRAKAQEQRSARPSDNTSSLLSSESQT